MSQQEDDESVAWVGGGSGDAPAVLLHGSLDIWIHEARNLPNMDILSKTVRDLICTKSRASDQAMTSDPYVTVQVGSAVVARTFVIPDNENPVWAQHFVVNVAHEAAAVNFVVKDSDVVGAELIGVVSIRADRLKTGERVEGTYPILERGGKECSPGAVLRLSAHTDELCWDLVDPHKPIYLQVEDARGPREPWHDLHSKIDGPAAYDVLKNFEERWLKASKRSGTKKLTKSRNDTLLWIEKIPDIAAIDDDVYSNDNDPERWMFKSVCGENVLIDMSVHTAYVNAIRVQYIAGANNLIPIEIALKIANKIYANERFSAFIIIPMWPEGNPSGTPTQRILYWQKETMQMMYEIIYKALEEVGLSGKYEPQDYLNFFCLGNREAEDTSCSSSGSSSANNPQVRLQIVLLFSPVNCGILYKWPKQQAAFF
ncbi:hypothetical protein HU200_005443 [Digitaria exilis]|uniref:C2 domain-containing protein n=1 Tax=Digitaria exilis TaxID=1010633 RepID=A0A835FRV8_9POAL|nr:hypothetical protein HU200_005443 [Digitaria exilis]